MHFSFICIGLRNEWKRRRDLHLHGVDLLRRYGLFTNRLPCVMHELRTRHYRAITGVTKVQPDRRCAFATQNGSFDALELRLIYY